MKTTELDQYLIELLDPRRSADYCFNGLQVEGSDQVDFT